MLSLCGFGLIGKIEGINISISISVCGLKGMGELELYIFKSSAPHGFTLDVLIFGIFFLYVNMI